MSPATAIRTAQARRPGRARLPKRRNCPTRRSMSARKGGDGCCCGRAGSGRSSDAASIRSAARRSRSTRTAPYRRARSSAAPTPRPAAAATARRRRPGRRSASPRKARRRPDPMRIAAIAAEPFHTPLHNPFVTARGTATAARAVAVHLTLDDGRTARGESVPVHYVTGETRETVLEAVTRIAPELVGLDVRRYRLALNAIARLLPEAPSARCALEMAVLDAWAQATGLTAWELWGAALDSLESDITIPIVPNAGELAALAWGLGIRVFKLKVGESDVEADHARVLAVREAAPEALLRIDANQAFTPDGAVRFVERLLAEGAQVQLLEQPVRKEDFEGLGQV